jgi:hypothetical protein
MPIFDEKQFQPCERLCELSHQDHRKDMRTDGFATKGAGNFTRPQCASTTQLPTPEAVGGCSHRRPMQYREKFSHCRPAWQKSAELKPKLKEQ